MGISLNSFFTQGNTNPQRFAIIRVQYNKLGSVSKVELKRSSGDTQFDLRGLEFVRSGSHSPLHNHGKQKGLRLSQWYEIRYTE